MTRTNEPVTDRTNEIGLMTALAVTPLDAERRQSIADALTRPVDWEYFFVIARRNAILPLVGLNLLAEFEPELAPEIATQFRQFVQSQTLHNMMYARRLVDIVRTFDRAGVPVLPFKGPLLAQQSYGHIAARQYIDLDILVPPKFLDEAVSCLTDLGYQLANDVNWLEKSDLVVGNRKDVGFIDEASGVRVELHWKLSGSHFSLPVEINRLWDALESTSFGGVDMKTLAPVSLLIYLCVHGSRHSWERLGWICDVHQTLLTNRALDWNECFAEAQRVGCERVLALGLRLVRDVFKWKVPPEVEPHLDITTELGAIIDDLVSRLFLTDIETIKIGDRYAYHLKLRENGFDRFKLHLYYLAWYVRIIFSPNEADKAAFRLPPALSPIYVLTRPFRLFYRYVLRHKDH